MGKAAKRAPAKRGLKDGEKVVVENVNHPGATSRVDAVKYKATRTAMLALLPRRDPGLTQAEMMVAMRKALPRSAFPGTTSSWWMKTVQLDLEAKGLVRRDGGKPLRWKRT